MTHHCSLAPDSTWYHLRLSLLQFMLFLRCEVHVLHVLVVIQIPLQHLTNLQGRQQQQQAHNRRHRNKQNLKAH